MLTAAARTPDGVASTKLEKGLRAMEIIINAKRDGYGTDQVGRTLTAGELIAMLEQYDEDTPVFIGNDMRTYGWYTYGSIREGDICERNDWVDYE